MRPEEEVGKLLTRKGITISVAESCTGGLIQKLITDVPGSSKYFLGGVVAYSNEFKQKLVKVNSETLKEHGAVSPEVAQELARGIMEITGSDIGLSTTGIAGPTGGTKEKPVGLVYVGVCTSDILKAERFLFKSTRQEIRGKAATQALKQVIELLSH